MAKQIAAANWKMNLTAQEGEQLINEILNSGVSLQPEQKVILAVPFPYLSMAIAKVSGQGGNIEIAAQNVSNKKQGAYTGEVSAIMLDSIGIKNCIVGHSERREMYGDTDAVIAEKVNLLLDHTITPIFCCGEKLEIRESGNENSFVTDQLVNGLFHLSADALQKVVIAYEPVWAIGTGKTASSLQAQEMHAVLRNAIAGKYGNDVAANITILYGGSVKADNAEELFSQADVDGGLVGGASLVAGDFIKIIKALKA